MPVSVVLPHRVYHFARGRGIRAKTDSIDARLLTAFGENVKPEPLPAPRPGAQELRHLVRARQQLNAQLYEESSHDEHCTLPFLQEQAQARRQFLESQIKAIEQRLRALIKPDPVWRHQTRRIREVQGIGEVSAWTVLAEMPELGQMDRGQAGALLGVVPDPNQSGPREGRRHISGGRAHARKVLYMAALTASQHNPVLAPFYHRLTQ